MSKRIYLMTVLGLTAMLFCSCGNATQQKLPEGEQTGIDTNAIQTYSFPTEYHAEGENVKVDMTIDAPEQAYFIEGTVENLQIDSEYIAQLLMNRLQLEYDSQGSTLVSKEVIGDQYKAFCVYSDYGVDFMTYPNYTIDTSVYSEKKSPEYNLPLYDEKKEFSFQTEEAAYEDIMEFLANVGLDLGDDIQTDSYYLDYETLQQEERHYDIDGNREEERYRTDWSEADNAYRFYIHQTYCGLRDYHTGDYWAGRAEAGNAQIVVSYNAEGIAEMSINEIGLYDMSGEEVPLLDMDEIVDGLMTHYENILDGAAYEVTEATLCCDYRSAGKNAAKNLVPVWAFQVTEKNAEGKESLSYEVRMNAATGEFL